MTPSVLDNSPKVSTRGSNDSIFSPELRLISIAMITIITIAAFDQTAIMSVMPAILSGLDSHNTVAYTLAFTSETAASIIAMVLAGLASDRFSAVRTLWGALGIFIVGVSLCAFSPGFAVFIAGRIFQGLGAGGLLVASYALVATRYSPTAQKQIFAAFSGAWVLPTLIGPGLAGLITVRLGWHWVFGISALIAVLTVPLLPRRPIPQPPAEAVVRPRTMILCALIVTACAIPVSLAGQAGMVGILIFLGGTVIALAGLRPILPAGTLTASTGLGVMLCIRFIFDGYFALEALLPLILDEQYGLGPKLTGLGLTGTGVTWYLAAQAQASLKPLSTRLTFAITAALLCLGAFGVGLVSLLNGHWLWIVVFWSISGLGIGYSYPRVTQLAMSLTPPGQAGFVSSGLQVNNMTSITLCLAAGTLIHALSPWSTNVTFFVIFGLLSLMPLVVAALIPRAERFEREAAASTVAV